jgi:type IV secretory pathway VirJ component
MRPAGIAAACAAALGIATFLSAAAPGQDAPPAAPAAPAEPTPHAEPKPAGPSSMEPQLGTLKLKMGQKRLIYIYAPPGPADPEAYAVIYFSGDWGWRPLQQETASHLARKGRHVVVFDSAEFFNRQISPSDWAADLETLRSYANEKAGKPPGTPVLLIGFTFGGELVPYMLNRGGTRGFAGALLLSLDREGAVVYRSSIQLKLPMPPEEVFNVAEEIRRLPPTFPVFLMDAAGDAESAMGTLAGLLRGPHRSATIDGADRSFRTSREAHLVKVDEALLWLESQTPGRAAAN